MVYIQNNKKKEKEISAGFKWAGGGRKGDRYLNSWRMLDVGDGFE